MWYKHWTEIIYVGQGPIFHGPLYLEDYLMDKCLNWNTESMWCKDLPDKMHVGQWPTFHGPVILSSILKTIWWINVVLEILIQCNTNIDLKHYITCRPVTYISWSIDFAIYNWIHVVQRPLSKSAASKSGSSRTWKMSCMDSFWALIPE